MKLDHKTIIIPLVFLLLTLGCTPPKPVDAPLCSSPYFEYRQGDCCLDLDGNKVCDHDQKKLKDPGEIIQPSTAKQSPKESVMSVSIMRYVNALENEEFGLLYDLSSEKLRRRKSRTAFVRRMEFEFKDQVRKVEIEKVTYIGPRQVTATLELLTGDENPRQEIITFLQNEKGWNAQGFQPFFAGPCGDNICTSKESDLKCGVLDCFNTTMIVVQSQWKRLEFSDKNHTIYFLKGHYGPKSITVDIDINKRMFRNLSRREGKNQTFAQIDGINYDLKTILSKYKDGKDAVRLNIYTPVLPLREEKR